MEKHERSKKNTPRKITPQHTLRGACRGMTELSFFLLYFHHLLLTCLLSAAFPAVRYIHIINIQCTPQIAVCSIPPSSLSLSTSYRVCKYILSLMELTPPNYVHPPSSSFPRQPQASPCFCNSLPKDPVARSRATNSVSRPANPDSVRTGKQKTSPCGVGRSSGKISQASIMARSVGYLRTIARPMADPRITP